MPPASPRFPLLSSVNVNIPPEPGTAPAVERFRIGELARRVGATPRTVRYYEELGLLPARGREEGAHRLYDAEDEARLADLLRVRDLLGLSLAELRDWMDAEAARAQLRERWHGSPAPAAGDRSRILAEALRHVETQVALVRVRRAALEQLEDELLEKRRRIRALRDEFEEQL
jgi:MerR family transcriptional regulator, repressor of the yfmOP operon